MEMGETQIEAGPVKIAMQYRKEIMDDQGLCVQVISEIDGEDVEILRFDCFDQAPHYHYGPKNKNERLFMDKTTTGNPLGWTLDQLRTRLPEMVERAGYDDLAGQIRSNPSAVTDKLEEVECTAREMSVAERRYVVHNRGEPVFEVGNVRFGLEFRELERANDRGLAVHLLSDVAGQEIELMAFDCFERAPHFHYGPRNKDIRIYWDTTTVPDTLDWTLDQFEKGNLPNMLERSGYPGIAAEMDNDLVRKTVREVIRPKAMEIRSANAK